MSQALILLQKALFIPAGVDANETDEVHRRRDVVKQIAGQKRESDAVVEILLECIKTDPATLVIEEAIRSLARLKNRKAVEPLIDLLLDRKTAKKRWSTH